MGSRASRLYRWILKNEMGASESFADLCPRSTSEIQSDCFMLADSVVSHIHSLELFLDELARGHETRARVAMKGALGAAREKLRSAQASLSSAHDLLTRASRDLDEESSCGAVFEPGADLKERATSC